MLMKLKRGITVSLITVKSKKPLFLLGIFFMLPAYLIVQSLSIDSFCKQNPNFTDIKRSGMKIDTAFIEFDPILSDQIYAIGGLNSYRLNPQKIIISNTAEFRKELKNKHGIIINDNPSYVTLGKSKECDGDKLISILGNPYKSKCITIEETPDYDQDKSNKLSISIRTNSNLLGKFYTQKLTIDDKLAFKYSRFEYPIENPLYDANLPEICYVKSDRSR